MEGYLQLRLPKIVGSSSNPLLKSVGG